MQLVRYVAKHTFIGDAAANQISFAKGEILLYDTRHQQNQGWVWVTVERTSQRGWCPLSYLEMVPEGPVTAQPPASAPPPIPSDTDDGFSGSAMGGTIQRSPVSVVSSTNDSSSRSSTGQPVMGTFSQIGSGIQRVGRDSWTAVSNGAQKAGEYTKEAYIETKQRVEDMTDQQKTIANKPAHLRTESEQRAVDVGNYGARGAVVGAVSSAIFHPTNLRGVARGATRGAVTGGAYGFVRKWKPFG